MEGKNIRVFRIFLGEGKIDNHKHYKLVNKLLKKEVEGRRSEGRGGGGTSLNSPAGKRVSGSAGPRTAPCSAEAGALPAPAGSQTTAPNILDLSIKYLYILLRGVLSE